MTAPNIQTDTCCTAPDQQPLESCQHGLVSVPKSTMDFLRHRSARQQGVLVIEIRGTDVLPRSKDVDTAAQVTEGGDLVIDVHGADCDGHRKRGGGVGTGI